jgi:4'-phosphopantetheinyl transferase
MKIVARWLEPTGVGYQPPVTGEVHLWRANLDGPAKGLETFPGPLSGSEQERAMRFKFADHRRRYVHTRSWLRKILGIYLQREPRAVPIFIAENGKPYLDSGAGCAGLRFNLSHSAGFALLAVTTGSEVGVDVQIESAKNDWPAIAERYFTVKEFGHIRTLPPSAQAAACVEIWTRKEAAGKALGIGLHSKTFSFAVGPAAWGKVRCGENLTVWSLAVEAPFAAAVAVQD